MEILLQIVNILLTVAAAVAVGVSPVLVHMAVQYLNRKLDASIKEDDEYRINSAVSNGIDYAEEWAAAKVKANLPKPTSADKEAAAVSFVDESIMRAGIAVPAKAWLIARIKAALAASSFGATGKSLLLPLLLAVGLSAGCGTSTAQQMALVATGTNALWTRGYPLADLACKAEAEKCKKPGELVPLDACPGAKRCLDALKLAQRLLDTADRAVMVGLPLAAADDPGAAAYLSAALAAYSQAMAALAEWGVAAQGAR